MILGLEVAREGASAAIGDLQGAAQYAARCAWAPHTPPGAQWLAAMQLCRDLLQRAALENAQIEGAGVVFDGLIANGVAQTDPTRPGWGGYDLARALKEHLGIAGARVASRVGGAGLGEAHFGALRGQNDWHYLHLSRDLEGASCFQGQNLGGDFGGLILERDGAIDAFGKRGTLRAYCGGAAFESRARSYGMSGQSAREIWALSAANFAAQSLCEDFTSRLAQGLASVLALFEAPVCIGGDFGSAIWPQIGPDLASKLREMAPKSPRLVSGALGEDAATLGALALALNQRRDRLPLPPAGES